MKVYLLIRMRTLSDIEYTTVMSVHSSYPIIPEPEQEPCGCCGVRFFVQEEELKP